MPKVKKALRPFILDTETTGFRDPVLPIQIAYVEAFGGPQDCEPGIIQHQLFNPGRSIEYGAVATHHIRQEQLNNEMLWENYHFPHKPDYFIGHSVGYDFGVIKSSLPKGSEPKLIDTCSIANIVFEDCDSHKLGALGYYMWDRDLVPPTISRNWLGLLLQTHEAVSDVTICWYLMKVLARKLAVESWSQFAEMSMACSIPTIMKFGKHADERICDIPDSYISWALGPRGMTDIDPMLEAAFRMDKHQWKVHFEYLDTLKARMTA